MFIVDLQLPLYDKDDDLEPEIKAWIRETIKINCSNFLQYSPYKLTVLLVEFSSKYSNAIKPIVKSIF